MDHTTLFTQLSGEYKKDTDVDFPINKIRFFMDFLWNSIVGKPLGTDQKAHLKSLIDLLNSLDDNKLSPTRELIQNMNMLLSPLLSVYPSLGHSFTVIVTTVIPAYQRYLSSLETQVKDAHAFSVEEVLLYYDMTLVDHIVLSHVFENEHTLNLIEVIETIKAVITINALTHDYLQDATGRSISMFTFLQRGGLPKDQTLSFYQEIVKGIVARTKENVSNTACIDALSHLTNVLTTLANQAGNSAVTTPVVNQPPIAPSPSAPLPATSLPSTSVFSAPVTPVTAAPVQPTTSVLPESSSLSPVAPVTPLQSPNASSSPVPTAATATQVSPSPIAESPSISNPVGSASSVDNSTNTAS